MGKIIPTKIDQPLVYVSVPTDVDLVVTSFINEDGNELILNTKNGSVVINLHSLIDVPMNYRSRTSVAQSMINGIAEMVSADYSNATTNKRISSNEKIENRFTLPKELFEAVDFTNMGVVEEEKDHMPTFIVGEKYSLRGVSCEGFEMPEKVYELVAIHDKFDGIDINSLIVKQVSGDQDKIFTLSKNDCEHIGIEYENGLQLFPKYLNWKRVKEIIPFDSRNLGTTPVSDIDNTIRYVLLKLNGFKDYTDGYVLTPSGKLIKEAQFEKTLRIVSNEPIVYEQPTAKTNGVRLEEYKPLKVEIAYPKGLTYNHGNFISSEDTVYVLIKLVQPLKDPTLIDGKSGIERVNLEGFNPNDHFTISWDELGAYTVEEYEAEKARKERLKQERIAREEAERRKKIEAEERRLKEQRKRTEEAVERMKEFKINIPKFPKMESFNMENGLSSLNLYMDGLDIYFDNLDKSLMKLSGDLNEMGREIGINLEKRIGKNLSNSTLFDMFKL